ncbi:threonine/serine exporter family protein [Aggregatilinea lenta]|uniref:threonine/serine exporter family protein n=1 Tax=Aggregatilinea lenta TaxID=913108 RepID=UPI000E5B618B|nr:threonine/serine exporter family protein [Aggregatilinea lenta]
MSTLALIEQGFWAFVATLGFAVLFNVPTRMLLVCGVAGALGHMWKRVLMAHGIDVVTSTFVGAMVVGLVGYTQARFFHMPRLIFTVTGIIPMVPGVPAFETMVYFMRDDISTGLETLVRAGLIGGAIAVGLVTARLLVSFGDRDNMEHPRGLWQRSMLQMHTGHARED